MQALEPFAAPGSLPVQTTDQDRPVVNGVQEPPQLKIEIPANRSAQWKSYSYSEIANGGAAMICFASRVLPSC